MTRANLALCVTWVGSAALALSLAGCGEHRQSLADTSDTSLDTRVETVDKTGEQQKSPTAPADPAVQIQRDAASTNDAKADLVAVAARGRGPIREISFDAVKFDMEKGEAFNRSMLTPQIEKLDGRRVRIRGYMLPSFQQSGIKQFVLVRDNMECCFGPGAALYDCIVVELVDDQSCNFSVRPIAVEGTFSVREFKGPDDRHLAIFHLDGERVR